MSMIKLYYYGVPVCMALQTVVLGYMALVLNKMRKERKEGRKHDAVRRPV